MSGRPPKPIEFSVIDNKSRYTKEEINRRFELEKEMQIGTYDFKPTHKILNNQTALKKWKELIALYKNFKFVTTIDTDLLEEYCITHSEYYELLDCKTELETKIDDKIKLHHATNELKIDYRINKKLEVLIKLQDRLFLSPVSRIKSIPVKKEESTKVDLADEMGFGNI